MSIGQNFLEPEDPSQVNFSGPGARSLQLTGTVTTEAYMLEKHVCMYVCIYNQEQSTHGVAITAPSLGQVCGMQETSTFTQTKTAHVQF